MTPPSRALAFGGAAQGSGASAKTGAVNAGSTLVGAGVNEIRAVS